MTRGQTTPDSNAGSYAPKTNSAPGAAAALAPNRDPELAEGLALAHDPWAPDAPAAQVAPPDLAPVYRDVETDPFGPTYNSEDTEFVELDHDRINADPDVGIMYGSTWYLYEAKRKFPGTAGPHGSVLLTDTDSAVVAINVHGQRQDVIVEVDTPAWSRYAATGDPLHLAPLTAGSNHSVAEFFGHDPRGNSRLDYDNTPSDFFGEEDPDGTARVEGLRSATVLRHNGVVVGVELGADITYEMGH